MADSRTFVLVGHCSPDTAMLTAAVQRILPGAPIERVTAAGELDAYLTAMHVLLINRVLDGEFASESGIELIESVAGGDDGPIALLISNFPESQDEAVAAGAQRGFGKAELYEKKTAEILREVAAG